MSTAPETNALLDQCRTGSKEERYQAALALGQAGEAAAIPVLLPLLEAEDSSLRSAATYALGRLGEFCPDIVGPALARRLADPDDLVRDDAAEALGDLQYQPARVALERVLREDWHATPRAAAAAALGELGDPRACQALIAALFDEDGPVRGYAATSLGLLGDPSALPAVQRRLAAEEWQGAKIDLARAAMRLGDDSGFDTLMAVTDQLDDDLVINWYNSIDELLWRKTPGIVIDRAAELDRRLMERNAPKLRERLAELCQRRDENAPSSAP
ncbi:HEAT repeat domain-containing protein [Haliangium sp.]|uniref:HEAT repeat domain-containing protein n=1 Tax=Haliangium sp. TaxID=2663208 RepID=UPI003D0FA9B3